MQLPQVRPCQGLLSAIPTGHDMLHLSGHCGAVIDGV